MKSDTDNSRLPSNRSDRENRDGNSNWLVIAVVASFALIPICLYGCGPEWARWDAAQAMQHHLRGETKEAIYQLTTAVERSPRDPVVKLMLAETVAKSGDPDKGLKLIEEVLDRYPNNRSALQKKSECQQYQGDFVGALETYQQYRDSNTVLSRQDRDWNELAYFRALAKKDLHVANQDIENAIESINRYRWRCGDLTLLQKTLVANVLISRVNGEANSAMELLNRQIDFVDGVVSSRKNSLTKRVHQEIQQQPSFKESAGDIVRELRIELRAFQESLAILLTVRALIHQDNDQSGFCLNDRQHVRELGFDAQEIAGKLPGEDECLSTLAVGSAYLDTRGLVRSLLIWEDSESELRKYKPKQRLRYSTYQFALDDLNISVLSTKTLLGSLDGPLHNKMESSLDPISVKDSWTKSVATMLYHRMTLYQKRGEAELASADEAEILALGFKADDSLF